MLGWADAGLSKRVSTSREVDEEMEVIELGGGLTLTLMVAVAYKGRNVDDDADDTKRKKLQMRAHGRTVDRHVMCSRSVRHGDSEGHVVIYLLYHGTTQAHEQQ